MAERNKNRGDQSLTILASTTITTAVTGTTTTAIKGIGPTKYLLVESNFTYGSSGTKVTIYIQTRVAGGVWRDIICQTFTTSSATKWSAVVNTTALAASQAASDGSLTDDTILNGLIGSEVRAKYTTTGTYADSTTLTIKATAKG